MNSIDDIKIKEMQSKMVISFLIKDHKLNLAEATKLWYNSRTKAKLIDGTNDYTHVSPARCYDELIMELNNDPHWMKGQFD